MKSEKQLQIERERSARIIEERQRLALEQRRKINEHLAELMANSSDPERVRDRFYSGLLRRTLRETRPKGTTLLRRLQFREHVRAADKRIALKDAQKKRLKELREIAVANPRLVIPQETKIDWAVLNEYCNRLKDNEILSLYYQRFAEEEYNRDFAYVSEGTSTICKEVPAKKFRDIAYRVAHCGTSWKFDFYRLQSVKDLRNINYCHDRFCLNCQKLMQAVRLVKFAPLLDEYAQTHDLYHMTLTVPNVEGIDLIYIMSKMWKSFKMLSRYLSGHAKIRGIDLSRYGYEGMIRNFEVTYEGDIYHPHFHVILVLKKGLDLPKIHTVNPFSYNRGVLSRHFSDLEVLIQKIWKLSMTGQEVNAENIRDLQTGYSCTVDRIEDNNYYEVFKYPCKPNENGMSYEQWKTLFAAMYKKKLFQGYGGLYRVSDVNLNEDNPIYDTIIAQLRYLEEPDREYMTLNEVYTDVLKNMTIISRKYCRLDFGEIPKNPGVV